MNETEVSQYIIETFEGVDVVVHEGNSFFFYNPENPPDHRFPFATLMTNDLNDQFSNLDRPSIFRLNIGVSKQTFRALFGEPTLPPYGQLSLESGENQGDYDFTALDQVMPHPVYGRQYWVCVLNPSRETLEKQVRPLLAEAYEMAVSRHRRRAARS